MHIFEHLWNDLILKRAFPVFVALGILALVAKSVS
jgi:hypothetical protein